MSDNQYDISGVWINKNTGNKINVQNYVSDGDSSIIVTDQGMIDMNRFMNDYVQMENDDMEPVNTNQSSSNANFSDSIFNQEYTFDDVQIKQENSSTVEVKTNSPQETINVNNSNIIQKLFNKIDSKPIVEVNIKWDDCPIKEISTLVNFLDVDIEDISKYIFKNFADAEIIIEKITNILQSKISNDK